MEMGRGVGSAGDVLAVIDAALSDLLDVPVGLESDAELLGVLVAGLRLGARLEAWQARVAARIDHGEVAWREHGTSTATWLVDVVNLTRSQAGRLVAAGKHLERFAGLDAAAKAGAVLPAQAEAIGAVLEVLPDELGAEERGRAEELMVGFAATHTSTELRRLGAHLVEVVAPEVAEASEAARVEREYRQACRTRHLVFRADHHGSVLLHGSVPVADAAGLISLVDAYAAAAAGRGVDRGDPAVGYVTPAMRRADGLLALADHHVRLGVAPVNGGDRPRIVVTMSYDSLRQAATSDGMRAGAGFDPVAGSLAGDGSPVPAVGAARKLVSFAAAKVNGCGQLSPGFRWWLF